MNTHNCIKCGLQYRSEDEDAYYCKSCFAEKQRVAAQVDADITTANRPVKTSMQKYEEAKARSSTPFPNVNQL